MSQKDTPVPQNLAPLWVPPHLLLPSPSHPNCRILIVPDGYTPLCLPTDAVNGANGSLPQFALPVQMPSVEAQADFDQKPAAQRVARPSNSFMLYRRDKMKELCELGLSKGAAKVLGEMWANEPEDVKEMYRRKAEIGRKEHSQKYPDFVYSPYSKGRKTSSKKSRPSRSSSSSSISSPATPDSSPSIPYCGTPPPSTPTPPPLLPYCGTPEPYTTSTPEPTMGASTETPPAITFTTSDESALHEAITMTPCAAPPPLLTTTLGPPSSDIQEWALSPRIEAMLESLISGSDPADGAAPSIKEETTITTTTATPPPQPATPPPAAPQFSFPAFARPRLGKPIGLGGIDTKSFAARRASIRGPVTNEDMDRLAESFFNLPSPSVDSMHILSPIPLTPRGGFRALFSMPLPEDFAVL
ncbi:hypothetical protein BDK51DRAFT_52382 [Blyttiomyces helicus]|uniref:HMG box domain-containing protein n=1 Tax=Blyttiomyces helicus TaxID=388810 RepID=A0A4P9WCA1_9FUNG|nr:hypothetical protein BDK51DRAFT_52382 [Blyttiomyces helicus]|eukprot:RKO89223.1 hypothetical protein BDK51DRAFT_52382 [Blyttiomyces helicus]